MIRRILSPRARVTTIVSVVVLLCLLQTPARLQETQPRDAYLQQLQPEGEPSRYAEDKPPRTRQPADPGTVAPPPESAQPESAKSASTDSDSDGVDDPDDNCPFTRNPLQTDGNADGLGDACTYLSPTSCGQALLDLTSTGTPLGLGDDDSAAIPLPFSFFFYGEEKTSVRIGSNGYLTFGADGDAFNNASIPDFALPDDLVSPFWDDLNPTAGGEVYYETFGSAPNRSFVVHWSQVPHFNAVGSFTFELLLDETANTVEFRYGSLLGSSFSNGASATVGLENSDGTIGIQHAFNTGGSVSAGVCLFFAPAIV